MEHRGASSLWLGQLQTALVIALASMDAAAAGFEASGLTRLATDLADGSRHGAVLVWPGIAVLLLSFGLFGIPVRALRSRRDGAQPSTAVAVLAWLAALCGTAFFAAMAVAVAEARIDAPASAALGPGTVWLALPWMMLTAAASVVWLRVRLARRLGRLEWAVVAGAVALIAFVVFEGIA